MRYVIPEMNIVDYMDFKGCITGVSDNGTSDETSGDNTNIGDITIPGYGA